MNGAATAAVSWKRVGTVTTLTNNQMCYTDGTSVICDSSAPTISSSLVGIGSTGPITSLDMSQEHDALALPVGTTGTRPTGGALTAGELRYNQTSPPTVEAYVNGAWISLVGGASGGGGTANYVARWTSSTALGIGSLYDTGTLVSVGTTTTASALGVYGGVSIGTSYVGTAAPTNGMIVQGNVGIGTASPGSLVSMYAASGNPYLTVTSGTGSVSGYFQAVDSSVIRIGSLSNNDTEIVTCGQNTGGCSFNPGLYLQASTGNVGIGTTSPGQKLDVNGNILLEANNPYIYSGGSWIGFPHGIYGYGGANYFDTVVNARGGVASDNSAYLTISGGTSGYTYFSGNVGIGTTTPGYKLTLSSNVAALPASTVTGTLAQIGNADNTNTQVLVDAFAAVPILDFRRADTTAASPSAVQAGDALGGVNWYGYGANAYSSGPRTAINGNATENWSNTANGTYLSFWTTAATTTTISERMRIDNAGNVGIGTTGPGATLDVNGNLHIGSFGSASTTLCESGGFIDVCSSSRRYKENIKDSNLGLR